MARPYPKFTYEDYLLLPEDKRYELVEGELIMVPAPNTEHQRIIGNLYLQLRQFVEERKIGEVFIAPYDVVLSRYDVVQPDLIFVSEKKLNIITEQNIQGVPDLVIEILSPDQNRDRIIKKKLYAKYGIKEYWIVDPESQTVEVMELDKKGYQTVATFSKEDKLTSTTFPGFSLPLKEIFLALV